MKITRWERVRKGLLRFGRKNIICRFLVMPLLVIVMFFFHTAAYLRANSKRLATLAMTFCLFVIYSSFSFPLFISGDGKGIRQIVRETDSDVELAPESELSAEDMAILADEDVLEQEELAEGYGSHGADGGEQYDADEILASLEGRGRTGGAKEREDVSESVVESPRETFDRSDWRLVLINKQHAIPKDYTFNLATIVDRLKCDERILDDVVDMLQAAENDGIHLTIRSPYRTHDYQVMLFQRKIDRYMKRGMSYMEAYQLSSQAVTLPGYSEHEVGLALDIVCDSYTLLEEGFGDTEAGKWLAANSYRYGFILRYPKGKEYYTGIEYEPWHFRYVGVEAATYITGHGITLEEFWEEL